MKVYLLRTDSGQYEDARTHEVGIYSTREKADVKKSKIEKQVEKDRKLSGRTIENQLKKYYADEFNCATITEFELL